MYIVKLGALDGKNIFYITHFYTVQVKTIICLYVYMMLVYIIEINVSTYLCVPFSLETLLILFVTFHQKSDYRYIIFHISMVLW